MQSSEIPRVGTDDAGANATAPESRARIAAAMISIRGIMLFIVAVCCSRSDSMVAFLLRVSKVKKSAGLTRDAESDFVRGGAWCL